MFLKYIQHFFLLDDFFQYIRILPVGNAKQQPIVIFHNVEQPDKAGAGQ